MAEADEDQEERVTTGVEGLDAILGGGLPRNHVYLVQGDAGCGKTTLALQFLLSGVRAGQRGIFVTLSESRAELLNVAKSHGWSLDGISIYEVRADENHLKPEEEYTAFHPSEVELGEAIQSLLDEVERVNPRLVVIDSLSEMRLLARDPLRYRRQILALKEFFLSRDCTVVFLDDPASKVGEHQFQTLAHGVFVLERAAPEYGRSRRRLQVIKLRGVDFDDGYHDLVIRKGGMVVFPHVGAVADNDVETVAGKERLPSGLPGLDAMLGGGPTRGTSLLVIGSTGSGKSTLCAQYAVAAAGRGEHVAFFTFDERLKTLLSRSAGVGMDMRAHAKAGRITLEQVDPAEMSPGEFAHRVRVAVERNHAKVVVIDSLNGYLNAMPGERFLTIQMHELLTYLGEQDVLTLVVVNQHGIIGGVEAPVDLSYLADTVLLMRYFEHGGRVRKSVAVVKTRSGGHEDSIRELRITADGIEVGAPLSEFNGVLTGVPTFTGTEALLREQEADVGGGTVRGASAPEAKPG